MGDTFERGEVMGIEQTIGQMEMVGGQQTIHPVTKRFFRKRVYDLGWDGHANLIRVILSMAKADPVITYWCPAGTSPLDGAFIPNDQMLRDWPNFWLAEDNLYKFTKALFRGWTLGNAEVYLGAPEVNAARSNMDLDDYMRLVHPYAGHARLVHDASAFCGQDSLSSKVRDKLWAIAPGIEAWPCRGSHWSNDVDVPIFITTKNINQLLYPERRSAWREDLELLDQIQTVGNGDLSRFVIMVVDDVGKETPVSRLRSYWKRGASLRIPWSNDGKYLGATADDIRG